MVASGGVLGEFGSDVVGGQAGCELTEVVVAGAVRSGGRSQLGIRCFCERREVGTMKVEQAVAAGSAVGEVGFNALIVHFLIVNWLIVSFQIVNLPIDNSLIANLPIVNWLIAN